MAKKKRITENKISTFSFAQEIIKDYWEWTPDELQAVADGDAEQMGQIIAERFKNAGMELTDFYVILHDKDVQDGIWNSDTSAYETIQKVTHLHGVGRLKEPAFIADIAAAIGIAAQYVERPKAGRYSFDDSLSYLVHIKYTEKYQYDSSEVCTIIGKSYEEIYRERKDVWEKGRAKVNKQKNSEDIDWLEEQILLGNIVKDQIYLNDHYYQMYAQYKRRLDDDFDAYATRKIYQTIQALESGAFKLTCFYIQGKPGSGKTFFTTKSFIPMMRHAASSILGQTWNTYSAAGKNGLDDYSGEEIVIMDDLRGSSMDASEWLRVLDPFNANQAACRYHNRTVCPHVVIIVCYESPIAFFRYLRSSRQGEAMDQFIRRLEALITVIECEDENFINDRLLTVAPVVKSDPHHPYLGIGDDEDDEKLDTIRKELMVEYDFDRYQENVFLDEEATAKMMVNMVLKNHHVDISAIDDDYLHKEERICQSEDFDDDQSG